MAENRKPKNVILFILLVILLMAWLLRQDKPVEVDASGIHSSKKAEEVAVQDMDKLVPNVEQIRDEMYWDSMELLAICVEAEAGNQDLEGKRLVVDVILNRADDRSGEWADTIEGVITQYWQFASYRDGGMDRVIEPSEETFEAVGMELKERSYPGIYYFREGGWPEYGTPWRKVGDHYFSKK